MALRSLWQRVRGPPSVAKTVTFNIIGFLTWVPVLAWFNLHVVELTMVDGPSMYPLMNSDKDSTLRRDVVLNWKWEPADKLERGMIVTLR
jgi:mitochondrial inner membrane protease subunit 2